MMTVSRWAWVALGLIVTLATACGETTGTPKPLVLNSDVTSGDVSLADVAKLDVTPQEIDAQPALPDAPEDLAAPGDSADVTVADAGSAELPVAGNPLLAGMPLATEVFDDKGAHVIQITLDPIEWQLYLDGVAKPDSQKVYEWHDASLLWDGVAYGQLAVRGFGNGSQIDNPSKPNIRVKFDHLIAEGVGPGGQKSVRLKASGQDPTFLREPLAYELSRSIGGHAPRTSWARVLVNGEDYGFYQVAEHADKRMFKTLFGNNDGNKYQSLEACLGLDCPPWGCDALKASYKGDPGDGAELSALAKAVTATTADTLLPELQKRVGLGPLLANYATDAVLSNLDGLASAGQNFTLYVDAKTLLIEVIAGGADLTFGNFKDAFYPLESPWGTPNGWCADRVDHLYQRIWQAPKTQALLFEKFRALQCGGFAADKLLARIDSLRALIKAQVYADPKGMNDAALLDAEYGKLKAYVTKRQTTLSALLGPCVN